MKWRLLLAVGLCIVALGFGGCGGESEGGGGAATVETYDEFSSIAGDEIARAYCSAIFDCPEKQSPRYVMVLGRFENKQACLDGAAEMMGIAPSHTETAAVEAGRAVFDADAANACLALLDDAVDRCMGLADLQRTFQTSACNNLLVGQQEVGEPCLNSNACVSGYCDHSSSNDVCYGECAAADALAQEGESCDETQCDDGLTCEWGRDSATCVAQGSRAVGESCSSSDLLCKEGLVCDVEGRCAEPPSYVDQDESCNPAEGSFCQPGFVCADLTVDSEGNASGTCQPARAQGESCQTLVQCGPSLYCDTTEQGEGTCQPPKQEGEACDGDSGECGSAMWCDSSGGTPQCTSSDDGQVCEIPDDAQDTSQETSDAS